MGPTPIMKDNNSLLVVVDMQEKLVPIMNNSDELVDRCNRLIRAAKALNLPILATTQYAKGLGGTVEPINSSLDEVKQIDKSSFSVMGCEEFNEELEKVACSKLDEPAVILCGIESHICLQQSAMDLLRCGYRVYIPVDCISSRRLEDHMFALTRMEKAGCIITSYEAIVMEMLGSTAHPAFKTVSKIIK